MAWTNERPNRSGWYRWRVNGQVVLTKIVMMEEPYVWMDGEVSRLGEVEGEFERVDARIDERVIRAILESSPRS